MCEDGHFNHIDKSGLLKIFLVTVVGNLNNASYERNKMSGTFVEGGGCSIIKFEVKKEIILLQFGKCFMGNLLPLCVANGARFEMIL